MASVTSLNMRSGVVNLQSSDSSIGIVLSGDNDINIIASKEGTQGGVTSLNSLTGSNFITSTGGSIVVTTPVGFPSGHAINIETVRGGYILPVNTLVNSPFDVNEWFDQSNVTLTKSTIENVSTNYIWTFIPNTPELLALKNISIDEIVVLPFNLPADFDINNSVFVPCLVTNTVNQSNNPVGALIIIANSYNPPNLSCQLFIRGLYLSTTNKIEIVISPFALFKGQ